MPVFDDQVELSNVNATKTVLSLSWMIDYHATLLAFQENVSFMLYSRQVMI